MIQSTPGAEAHAERLSALLDEEVALLELRLEQIAALSDAVLDNEPSRLEAVLAEMERAEKRQEATDRGLQALRGSMAAALGREAGAVKLSDLIDTFEADKAAALDCRRREIVLLAEQVQDRHLQAAVVLTECARVNRMLMGALLGPAGPVHTYDRGGQGAWHTQSGLIDAEL